MNVGRWDLLGYQLFYLFDPFPDPKSNITRSIYEREPSVAIPATHSPPATGANANPHRDQSLPPSPSPDTPQPKYYLPLWLRSPRSESLNGKLLFLLC